MNLLKAIATNLMLKLRPKRKALVSELYRRKKEKEDRLKNPSKYGPDSPDKPENVSKEISDQADVIESAMKILARKDAMLEDRKKAKEQNKPTD